MKNAARILHLENDKDDAFLVRSMLETEFKGCDVVWVQTGGEFTAAIKQERFDLILSDFTFPSFNGAEALKIAQAESPDVPFIFVSGTIGEDPAIESLLNGATDYVLKHKMSRFIPAVKRAMQEGEDRRERNRLEEALRKSLRLVEQSADSILITDRNGSIEYVNPGFEKTTGYVRDEVIGKTPSILKSGKHSKEFYQRLWLTVLSGKTFHAQFQNQRKNGELYCQEETITPILDPNGRVSHFVSTGRDITDRKKGEEALRESEERFKMLFEFAPDAYFMTDLEGSFIDGNRAAEELTEYSREELIGKNFFKLDLLPLTEMARAARLLSRNAAGEPTGPVEFALQTKNRRKVFVEIRTIPVHMGDRLIMLGIARNVTERKQAEHALRESEARYRRLFEEAVLGIFQSSPDGKILAANPAFARMFGFDSPDDMKARVKDAAADIFADPERRSQILRITAENPGLNTFENLYRRKDGSTFIGNAHIHLVKGEKGRLEHVEGVIEDISERKRAEQAVRESAFWMRESQRVARIGSYVTDFITGRWTSSEVLDEVFGIDEDFERSVEGWASLVHPDEREMMVQYLEDIIARRAPFQKDYRIVRRSDGEVRWVSGRGELEFDDGGKLLKMFGTIQDITERMKSEEELRDSRSQYQELVENINDIIYAADNKGVITYISPVVEVLGGYKQSDLLGRSLTDIIHPDDLQALPLNRERTPGVLPSAYEYRMKTKTGEWLWVRSSSHPTKDGTGLRGILSDITERKRSENLLRASEERFRSVWEHSADGMRLTDRDGRIIEVNEAYCSLVKMRREELLGELFSIAYTRGGIDGDPGPYRKRFESGELVPRFQTSATLWNGDTVELDLSTSFVETDTHEKMILSIFRDVTEQERAEQENILLAQTLKSSKDCISISDLEGRMIFVNDAFLTTYGYSEAELIGKSISVVRAAQASAPEPEDILDITVKGGWHGEMINRRKDGREFPVELWTTVVKSSSGIPMAAVGVARDLTERKQLQQQLIQAQKMESIGTLAGGIAHDFNNILAIILGHVELLNSAKGDEAQFKRRVATIAKTVERGASLVRQILTFARKTETRLQSININNMIIEQAKMLGETFPKTVTVALRLDNNVPIISMDPTQLHQTLMNLCVNARDAMNDHGELRMATRLVKHADVAVRFPEASANHYVQVSVSDTGSGMDEETKRRIFEPFFTTKAEGKGTGLGLAVVYGVLQAHGGFVDVETAPCEGTTFHLFFPVPEGLLSESMKTIGELEEIPGGSETILLVEDEAELSELLRESLTQSGYRVIVAKDGEEAVRVFDEHVDDIALVLSDMGLPKRNGWEAIKMMREKRPGIPAILASGYFDAGHRAKIVESGVERLINKPYSIEEVRRVVREVLDQEHKGA